MHAACANAVPHPSRLPARTSPRLIFPLSTRQGKNSLSNANKLLIRCAWAGTSALATAGYQWLELGSGKLHKWLRWLEPPPRASTPPDARRCTTPSMPLPTPARLHLCTCRRPHLCRPHLSIPPCSRVQSDLHDLRTCTHDVSSPSAVFTLFANDTAISAEYKACAHAKYIVVSRVKRNQTWLV